MTTPEQLGKYRVTGVLGEGAMGVVYKGFDPGIGRVVALKTIRRHLMTGADAGSGALARFRNEAQAAGRLSHPGIVAVYDFGDEGEIAYIAMEYVEGRALARVLGGDLRFADDDILSLMAQLLDALGHAHDNGVWHRDIKPGNLIIAQDGRLKIADFGIARIEGAALTQVTSVVGTPGYMAPEQFMGKGIDRRADLYAAGVLFYQLLVGRPPFTGSPEALMYRVVHEPPLLPSQLPDAHRDGTFDDVIATALAKDPARRFDSAAAFKQAITDAAGRPVRPALSDDTLVSVMRAPPPPHAAPPSTASAPAHWDAAVLAKVEATLAHHVGPLASVLVRRAARDCHDLPALYAKLADQVTSPTARDAFTAQLATFRTGGATGGNTRPPPAGTPTTPPTTGGSLVTDALAAPCVKLLAQHIGPIAPVVVKRAAAKHPTRAAFFIALEEAVPDADARAQLRAALAKLPRL
jgi:eukaryotic-like serine/threonine-protein kinase